jgi:hypothetical protein
MAHNSGMEFPNCSEIGRVLGNSEGLKQLRWTSVVALQRPEVAVRTTLETLPVQQTHQNSAHLVRNLRGGTAWHTHT